MKKCFLTQDGPKAIGPYSTAVIHGNTCYLSGVIPVVAATGRLAEGGIEAQTKQVFENIRTILAEMGVSTGNILKTTVFLRDMATFGAMNAIYADFFGSDFPARSCVEVAALPMGALVEMEAVIGID